MGWSLENQLKYPESWAKVKQSLSIAMEGKKPWNYGLTKESDKRVQKAAIKTSEGLKRKYQIDPTYRFRTTAPMHTSEAVEKMRRTKKGKISHRKGITLEEEYGENKALEIRKKTSKNRKGKAIGKNASNWRGGIDKRRKYDITSFEYTQWRKAVFERDNYTCQHCGKTNCYLEAHHTKPKCLFPELALDVDIGLTLCKECHDKTKKLRLHRLLSSPQKKVAVKKLSYLLEHP